MEKIIFSSMIPALALLGIFSIIYPFVMVSVKMLLYVE
jgi:hypothetical protein